ncbi:methyl-accepting chemotaxis protein [Spirochaetia bacterium 38H-sp]|uniref:Methyl-accepting chemotaxis protein n=1 Tax=Rarispira pelagica TaxID=3141764 RepID=A0ABU9UDE6_9SPIR
MNIKKSIRSKFIILLSSISLLIILSLSIIAILSIKNLGKKQIEGYRTTAMEDAKTRLKNYTDIAFATTESIYKKYKDTQWLQEKYGKRLKNIIDEAESIINHLMIRVQRGEISTYTAKQEAIKLIRSIRYDGGTGYIWINDTTRPYPYMIMHPTIPELDGKILNDKKYNVADGGKNLFVAFLDVTDKDGEGFVRYLWPKPTKEGLTEEQPKLSFVRLFKPLDWIIGTGFYIDDIDKNVLLKEKEIDKTINTLVLTVILASAVLVIVGVITAMLFIIRITRPLRLVIERLKELSKGKGDLRGRLPELTQDEVGVLSGEFNIFVEQLASIIVEIRNNIRGTTELGKHLESSTQELSEKVDILTRNANETLAENNRLVEQIEKTNIVVNSILDFLQDLTEKIEAQASAVTQSSASIQQITASIGNISRVADERKEKNKEIYSLIEKTGKNMENTVNSIADISKSADDIKSLVSVIREIAEHTNLLSINASIEAAHAGDAGAGFSVVADEINRLATTTASHASRISGEIESILHKINDSYRFSTETSDTLKRLMDYVKLVTEGIEEIQLGLKELSIASGEIYDSTNSLINISQDMKNSSSGTKEKADYIRNTLSDVNSIADNTRKKMQILGKILVDMEGSFIRMREAGNKTVKASQNLQELIMRFSL